MLMTRPRISLGTISCTSELIEEKTMIMAMPPTNSSAWLRSSTRESANPIMKKPNVA